MKNGNGTNVGVCGLGAGMAALLVLPVVALAEPGSAQEPASKDLKVFYQQNCAGCHGADGSAVGPKGKKLSGEDLTSLKWQKSTADAEMVKVILRGKFFGWAMPAFKDKLTQDEVLRLVTDVIRKSKKGTVIGPDAAKASASSPAETPLK